MLEVIDSIPITSLDLGDIVLSPSGESVTVTEIDDNGGYTITVSFDDGNAADYFEDEFITLYGQVETDITAW